MTLGVIAALGVVVAGLWHVSRARCFALTGPVICRVDTDRPLVALTFDDGPTPLGVRTLLPILERYDAKATFFLIGRDLAREPALARPLLASGHEIANHSYSHERMIGRPQSVYDHEIRATSALLDRAGGGAPFFRPPYGKKLFGLPLVVRRQGMSMVLWDVEDPATEDPAAFADQVVRSAKPGSIILLHAMYPANDTARQALPAILAGLKAKGLGVVTVGELLKDQPEHADPRSNEPHA